MDCTTSPFTFCNGVLAFQSTDVSWEGIHEFSALGFTWTVLLPGTVAPVNVKEFGAEDALEAETKAK